jgi:predicted RNase H-like HicB family nuclease
VRCDPEALIGNFDTQPRLDLSRSRLMAVVISRCEILRPSSVKAGSNCGGEELETQFYRALIVQDEADGSQDGYGVVFPDLPGCTSSGDTIQEAYEHAFEALALHVEGMIEEGAELPERSAFNAPLPNWLAGVPGKVAAPVLVPVKLPGRAVRISVTMDKGLLARLDTVAATSGETRSGYIAQAVRERMEREYRRPFAHGFESKSSGHGE